MTTLLASKAHVEAGDRLADRIGAVDQVNVAAAEARCVQASDGAVFASDLQCVDAANERGLLNKDIDFTLRCSFGPDAVGPAPAFNVGGGAVRVLGGRAAEERGCGKGDGNGAVHGLGSFDVWTSRYIGLPFLAKGRTRAGLDCWGLIRLVYAEQAGVQLPLWLDGYSETDPCDGTAAHLAACAAEFAEIQKDDALPGDILLFRMGRHLAHVGLALPGCHMLHIVAGVDSCVESYLSPKWRPRLHGAYRPEVVNG